MENRAPILYGSVAGEAETGDKLSIKLIRDTRMRSGINILNLRDRFFII